mmetsp:Transcript_21842/g.21575  ORF Transcript_21842/g.21575 Transcript_21842/m.21575 type:complete len:133 (-) Transcript_21842:122-520(-)
MSLLPAPLASTFAIGRGTQSRVTGGMLIPASGADTNIAPAVRFQRLEDDYAGGDYEYEETDGSSRCYHHFGLCGNADAEVVMKSSGSGVSSTPRLKRKYFEIGQDEVAYSLSSLDITFETLPLCVLPKKRSL